MYRTGTGHTLRQYGQLERALRTARVVQNSQRKISRSILLSLNLSFKKQSRLLVIILHQSVSALVPGFHIAMPQWHQAPKKETMQREHIQKAMAR